MISFLIGVGVILALFMSTYGWGSLIIRALYGSKSQPPAFTAALGVALFVFIGGILNITHTVRPLTIDVLVFGGIGLALLKIINRFRQDQELRFTLDKPVIWVMGIITGYFVLTLFPMTGFNFHDDFHAYLIFPFRMLQTGTVIADSDALIGHGALNAQSFFQAILLRYFSVGFINSFDILFCFMLSGLLLDEIGKKVGIHWLYRLIPLTAYVVINPQLVNISPIYSGSLMVLGLVFGSMLVIDSEQRGIRQLASRLIPMALFAAAITVLKITFLGFISVYIMLFVLFLKSLGWSIRQMLKAGFVLGILILIFASPWLFITIDSYIGILLPASRGMVWQATENLTGAYTYIPKVFTPTGLFSTSRLFWGGSYIGYMLMLIIISFSCLIPMRRMIFGDSKIRESYAIVAVSAFLAALVSVLLLAFQVRPDLAIRYSCPLLIAVFPLTISVLGSPPSLSVSSGKVLTLSVLSGSLLAGQFLVIGQFIDVFADNLAKSYEKRSLLAFPVRQQSYYDYINSSFYGNARNIVRGAQMEVPEGEPVFAWLATPFHLDFARNEVLAISTPGITQLARRVDLSAGAREFEAYLLAQNIKYLIWSRNSYGMRSKQMLKEELKGTIRNESARDNLDLISAMEWLMRSRSVLYDERGIIVIEIKE